MTTITKEFEVNSGHAKCPICNGTTLTQEVSDYNDVTLHSGFKHFIPACKACGFAPSPLFYHQDTDRRSSNASATWDVFVNMYFVLNDPFSNYVVSTSRILAIKNNVTLDSATVAILSKLTTADTESVKTPFSLTNTLAKGSFQSLCFNMYFKSIRDVLGRECSSAIGAQRSFLNFATKAITIANMPDTTEADKATLITSWGNNAASKLKFFLGRFNSFVNAPTSLISKDKLTITDKEGLFLLELDDIIQVSGWYTQLRLAGDIIPRWQIVE